MIVPERFHNTHSNLRQEYPSCPQAGGEGPALACMGASFLPPSSRTAPTYLTAPPKVKTPLPNTAKLRANFALCVATTVLSILLTNALRRRSAAEPQLAKLAATDGLTGLSNRRHFDETLDSEWRRALRLVAQFVEQGATATDDNRPEFQKMIERACDDDHPYDVIVVYAFSRSFAMLHHGTYICSLKAGVRPASITHQLGDDPAQVMMRQIIGLFDEYQSRENGKHVRKAMVENARQGFYNGSPILLGYKTVEVDKRGARIKKKLAIDAVEAETVKLIFRLYRQGDGTSGPLGVKNLTTWLNSVATAPAAVPASGSQPSTGF